MQINTIRAKNRIGGFMEIMGYSPGTPFFAKFGTMAMSTTAGVAAPQTQVTLADIFCMESP